MNDIQKEILTLKEEKKALVLAHCAALAT